MSNCGKKIPRLSSVTSARKNDNTVEARASEILKYILKYYFSMENSDNKSNKKAIMEVLCGESHSEQINIYVTSIRFGGGTDAMIFNYKTAIWSISFLCFTEHLFGGLQLNRCKCIHALYKHFYFVFPDPCLFLHPLLNKSLQSLLFNYTTQAIDFHSIYRHKHLQAVQYVCVDHVNVLWWQLHLGSN